MSYARFGWDGSDVYVFADVTGGITCAACALGDAPPEPGLFGLSFPPSWRTPTQGPAYEPGTPYIPGQSQMYGEMIVHLSEHVGAGHTVPDDAFDRLTDEMNAALAAERATE